MFVDTLGTPLEPGQYIAYAVREGSCFSALRIGRVTGVDNAPLISLVMRARRWHDDTYFAKRTTLSHPDRAVVLHPDTIPSDVKELLEALPEA